MTVKRTNKFRNEIFMVDDKVTNTQLMARLIAISFLVATGYGAMILYCSVLVYLSAFGGY